MLCFCIEINVVHLSTCPVLLRKRGRGTWCEESLDGGVPGLPPDERLGVGGPPCHGLPTPRADAGGEVRPGEEQEEQLHVIRAQFPVHVLHRISCQAV